MLAEPDSKVLLLSEDMEFLVLATDGLWEKVWMCFLDLSRVPLKRKYTDTYTYI